MIQWYTLMSTIPGVRSSIPTSNDKDFDTFFYNLTYLDFFSTYLVYKCIHQT